MKRAVPAALLLLLLATGVVAASSPRYREASRPDRLDFSRNLPNTIIVGWDGVQRDHFWQCLNAELPECPDGLPHLQALAGNQIYSSTVTSGATATMPGWAQILSGYDDDVMGIYDNDDYQPLPEGYSIFEKLKAYLGDESLDTVFVAGKGRNVGATCQGEVNVLGNVELYGQPWCLTQRALDRFVEAEDTDLPTEIVGERVVAEIVDHFFHYPDRPLVAFFHFAEPDWTGHFHNENSVEYSQALVELDVWLGTIIARLQEYGAYESTLVYVLTDHGFDEDMSEHANAPYGFLATNDPLVVRSGDRKDLAPTLLERYGVDPVPGSPIPPVDGRSLYSIPSLPCVPTGDAYLDYPGSPACCEGLDPLPLMLLSDSHTARDRCVPATGATGDGSGYCTTCGDGQCSADETDCTCPEDCSPGSARDLRGRQGGRVDLGSVPTTSDGDCPTGTLTTHLLEESFNSWPPAGWTVVDHGGDCAFEANTIWGRPNNTGGGGASADADSDRCGPGTTIDTELRSPALDLSGLAGARLQYQTHYLNYLGEDEASVEISTDGGSTWANLLLWSDDHLGPETVDLDLTPFVGSSGTILRWRYGAPGWDWYWEVDEVRVSGCEPAPPGLYLEPAQQVGFGCPGTALDHDLFLFNNTGYSGTFSLNYDSGWPVTGTTEIYLDPGQTVSLTTSLDVRCGGPTTTTVTASGASYTGTASIHTAVGSRWVSVPPMPTPRGDLAAVAASDGLYAMGGTVDGVAPGNGENERYDPTTGTWTALAPMPHPLTLVEGAEVDGIIYIPGGHAGDAFTSTVLAYDTDADVWAIVSPAPRPVAGYGVAACGGRLYRAGGAYFRHWPLGDAGAEVYDPASGSWSPLPPMNSGHLWPAMGCIGDRVYVAGGIDEGYVRNRLAELYDPATGQWDDQAMADLPHPWLGGADFVRNGRLYLAGGFFAGRAVAATMAYDPAADAWSYGPPLEDARYRLEGDSLQGTGYVIGGWEPVWSSHASADVLPLCPLCVHVGGIGMRAFGGLDPTDPAGYAVLAGALVLGDDSRPVPGLTVTSRWTLPAGYVYGQEAVTRPPGLAWFRVLSRQTGSYQLCVEEVVGRGFFYAAEQNVETCDAVQVP